MQARMMSTQHRQDDVLLGQTRSTALSAARWPNSGEEVAGGDAHEHRNRHGPYDDAPRAADADLVDRNVEQEHHQRDAAGQTDVQADHHPTGQSSAGQDEHTEKQREDEGGNTQELIGEAQKLGFGMLHDRTAGEERVEVAGEHDVRVRELLVFLRRQRERGEEADDGGDDEEDAERGRSEHPRRSGISGLEVIGVSQCGVHSSRMPACVPCGKPRTLGNLSARHFCDIMVGRIPVLTPSRRSASTESRV